MTKVSIDEGPTKPPVQPTNPQWTSLAGMPRNPTSPWSIPYRFVPWQPPPLLKRLQEFSANYWPAPRAESGTPTWATVGPWWQQAAAWLALQPTRDRAEQESQQLYSDYLAQQQVQPFPGQSTNPWSNPGFAAAVGPFQPVTSAQIPEAELRTMIANATNAQWLQALATATPATTATPQYPLSYGYGDYYPYTFSYGGGGYTPAAKVGNAPLINWTI